MIANPCAMSTRFNRTPTANVFILLFLSASSVPWKVLISTAEESVGKPPPANEVKLRVGDRDNTPDEIENNSRPQRVQNAADSNRQEWNCQFLVNNSRRSLGRDGPPDFRILDFELLSRPMPQFAYRARDAQGALVEGVIDCADRAIAIRQIEQKRCIPIKIEVVDARPQAAESSKAAKPAVTTAPSTPTQSLKIPHGQLLIFTEQL